MSFCIRLGDHSQEDTLENPEWLEEFKPKWLNLFRPNHNNTSNNVHFQTDSMDDLVLIDPDLLWLDWHSNIYQLLLSPLNWEKLIRKREAILDKINKLPKKDRKNLYKYRDRIFELNHFWSKFDNFHDLESIIKELEDWNWGSYDTLASILLGVDVPSYTWLEEIRELIPEYLLFIKNIEWDFFSEVVDELTELFEKANNFSIDDLKRIYKTKNREEFDRLRSNVKAFCNAYSCWDWILIVSDWARKWYIETVEITDENNESASEVRDIRYLLIGNELKFKSHTPNNLPNQGNVEIYSWLNGSGKSTWLKTRLMLQMFFQTYWKAPAKNPKLKLRPQIIFLNRWWSGYWEDLSAFWNDVNRVMSFIWKLKEWAIIFLDEFWSTIPEKEAYYLIQAFLDYLSNFNIKINLATHNERYISHVLNNTPTWTSIYHLPNKYKLKKLKEKDFNNLEAFFDVFKKEWLPNDILKRAKKWILWIPQPEQERMSFEAKNLSPHSTEEREKMNKEIKWYIWLTRINEVLKLGMSWWRIKIGKKYQNFQEEENPDNPYYDFSSGVDIFFERYSPDYLEEIPPPDPDFTFKRLWKAPDNDPIRSSIHLISSNYSNGTLDSLTTWWLTSNIKELKERQVFFEEIWNWSYESANEIFEYIDFLVKIIKNFQDERSMEDQEKYYYYYDLSNFNKAYWEYFIDNLEKHIKEKWLWKVYEWFLILVDMEEKLGNLPEWFKEINKDFLSKIKKESIWGARLKKRYNGLWKRTNRRIWKWHTNLDLVMSIADRINEILKDIWSTETKSSIEIIKTLHSQIDTESSAIDVLTLSSEDRNNVISFLDDSKIFEKDDSSSYRSIEKWFLWMVQIIWTLKWNWSLLTPLLDKLKSFDSVHSHQIANYLEYFVVMPTVEDFIDLLRKNRDDENFYRYDYPIYVNHSSGMVALMELLWIIDIANQIKKLWWTKAQYNNTWEIDIKWISHPWVSKTREKQRKNDIYLWPNQSFEILEWATMWWKTFNIQSMYWLIRLAHSVWYVPADYANIPVFDWLIYIDRILEDEKKWLSAWQNDIRTWAKIIKNFRESIKNIPKTWRYWFSIDEILSSIPARFQKWIALALVEELTSLWHRWQISIHHPDFVSKILESNPEAYVVRHPEIRDNGTNIIPTYELVDWRSVDPEWDFTSYSLKTAERMWLPKEIIERAEELKNNDKSITGSTETITESWFPGVSDMVRKLTIS